MKKFYVNKNDLNSEEIKTGKISYKRLVDRFCNNRVLCNKVGEIDDSIWWNFISDYTADDDLEVYQYYLVDMSSWDLEFVEEYKSELILSYSDVLDLNVLMVDHFGTSWDYVMTGIEWSENFEECI